MLFIDYRKEECGLIANNDEVIKFWARMSLLVNLMLTIAKGWIGFIAHSDALIADAAHSATDVAGSIAVLIGLYFAKRPADKEHPYGHGKAEFLAASVVAILLLLAGIEVLMKAISSFGSVLHAPAPIALFTSLIAVLIKEILYRFQGREGKKRNSPALIAGAIDHRSDVYASLLAAAGIGVALVGIFFHQPLFYYADPIAGMLVAVIVIVIGFRLIRDSSISLMDVVVDNEEKSAVYETIVKVPGVMRIDDLRMRTNGSYFLVDVKIGVDPSITVLEGHTITKQVKSAVLDRHPQVYDILVHVNPYFAD